MKNCRITNLFIVLAFIFLGTSELSAQVRLINFSELKRLQQKEKRLVMVLVGTEWCKYCNAMKNSILRDKNLKVPLATNFYTVLLNAEDKNDIFFADRVFKYKPTGLNTGVHQLAEGLATIQGQLSYPSLVFLNDKNEIVYQNAGFLDPAKLAALLQTLKQKD